MANPAPGFIKRPDHRITLGPPTGTVTVTVHGETVAQTRRAILLQEKGYPARHYLPLEDVAAGVLTASERTTYCPFKGRTTYFDVVANGETLPDAAWSYPEPYDEMAPIAGHVAFDGPGIVVDGAD